MQDELTIDKLNHKNTAEEATPSGELTAMNISENTVMDLTIKQETQPEKTKKLNRKETELWNMKRTENTKLVKINEPEEPN